MSSAQWDTNNSLTYPGTSITRDFNFNDKLLTKKSIQSGRNSFKNNVNWNIDSGGGYDMDSNRRSLLSKMLYLSPQNINYQAIKTGRTMSSSERIRYRKLQELYPKIPDYIVETISSNSDDALVIKADGVAPISGDDCWFFTNNPSNNEFKINWYFYIDGYNPNLPADFKFSDLEAFYFVVTLNNSDNFDFNKPWITLYTKPEDDGNNASWYRTRYSYAGYYDNGNNLSPEEQTLAGQKYIFYIGDMSLVPNYTTGLTKIKLDNYNTIPPNAQIVKHPSNTTPENDKIWLIAVSSDSINDPNRFNFCIHSVGYKFKDKQQVILNLK